MWNPSESDLIESWLSFLQLHELGLVSLNPWNKSYKALSIYDRRKFKEVMRRSRFGGNVHEFVISNPRAYIVAYNSGMDFLSNGSSCVNPETFATWLSEVKKINREALFNEDEIVKATELLRHTLNIEQTKTQTAQTQNGNGKMTSGHVTIEHTKKSIKVQQLVAATAGFIGLLVGIFGDPQLSYKGFAICIASAIWLIAIIPLQKWWHHG